MPLNRLWYSSYLSTDIKMCLLEVADSRRFIPVHDLNLLQEIHVKLYSTPLKMSNFVCYMHHTKRRMYSRSLTARTCAVLSAVYTTPLCFTLCQLYGLLLFVVKEQDNHQAYKISVKLSVRHWTCTLLALCVTPLTAALLTKDSPHLIIACQLYI
jgi:hypothetical protein